MDVTFLHGLGQSPQDWAETVAHLPENVTADCTFFRSAARPVIWPYTGRLRNAAEPRRCISAAFRWGPCWRWISQRTTSGRRVLWY